MKKILLRAALSTAFVCLVSFTVNAQIRKSPIKTLEYTGKAAVFVVGQTAKMMGKAAVKSSPLALKAAEKTSVFILKQTKDLMVKTALPASRKLIVKYLKYRLMP